MKIRAVLTAFCLTVLIALPALAASYPDDCPPGSEKHNLASGADYFGDNDDECVDGGGGQNRIDLQGGTDAAFGEADWDDVDGGGSSDYLFGQGGDDTIDGGSGQDLVDGGNGNDILRDGSNPSGQGDVVDGGDGFDTLYHCTKSGAGGGADSWSSIEDLRTTSTC